MDRLVDRRRRVERERLVGRRRRVERDRSADRRRRVELAIVAVVLGAAGLVVASTSRAGGDRPDAAVDVRPTAWAGAATIPFEAAGRRVPLTPGGPPATASPATHSEVAVVTPPSPRVWRGVGAALTDASVTLLSGHDEALDLLFDPSVPGGAGLDVVRLPLSATDFSVRGWTWELVGDRAVLPPEGAAAVDVLHDVLARRPDLEVIAAAWTAPTHLRSDPARPGGRLVDVDGYGRLLAGQVAELRALGVPLVAISLGNEPGVVTDGPSLEMTDAQLLELADRLRPGLRRSGVELHALDHNWSDADRAADLVAGGDFDAVAFHCYDGEPSEMARLDVPTFVSECTATTGEWHSSVGWMARELIGDAVLAGSTGLVMWNLALDADHGPKQPGGCETCRGLLTVEGPSLTTTPEFSVLAHLSAAADPGARILQVERVDELPVAAFANPDGTVGIFGHNDRAEPRSLSFRIDGRLVTVDVPSWAVFSLRG